MIAASGALATRWAWQRTATLLAGAVALGAVVALRAAGLHEGLLYPDGYQYLLMARGIAEHLEPVIQLGPDGELLGPNPDAAAKPLFPLLVALLDLAGLSPSAAARAVTVMASAAVPALTGLLALRLGAGRAAAVLAAALVALSPGAAFWFGFAGPDPLAPALALAAALALLARRPVVGGALAGLCMLARPEYALAAAAAALAGLAAREARAEALRATPTALLVAAGALLLVRSPVTAPDLRALAGAVVVACVAGAALLVTRRMGTGTALGLAGAVILALGLADRGAWSSLAGRDGALLLLAAAGLVLACRRPDARTAALGVVALALPLAAVYWVKNPGLERYLIQLVPALALVAALGIGTVRDRRLAAAAGALALAGALAAAPRSVGVDAFRELAPSLEHAPAGALVTAAPDAYAVLLPERPIRTMRRGATGLVLVDGAARALEPSLRARGTVVARIPVLTGFLRPDGVVDRRPALLVRGRVVSRG